MKYRTLGEFFDRVFRNDLNANFGDIDNDVKKVDSRVSNIIKENPQPSEVVDAREGFPVLRDRLEDVDVRLGQKALQTDLDVTNEQLAHTTNKESFKKSSKGVVTFIFDDLYQSFYDHVFEPILKPNNIPFGVAMTTREHFTTTGRTNEKQTLDVLSRSEVLWHGLDHTTINSSMSEGTLINNIEEGMRFFNSRKIDVRGWVAPNTSFDINKEHIVQKYFNFGFSNCLPDVVDPNKSKHQMNRISTDAYKTMSDIQHLLNRARDKGEWLVIYGHRYNETNYANASLISDVVNWCNSNNVEIMTPTKAFTQFNATELNVKFKETNQLTDNLFTNTEFLGHDGIPNRWKVTRASSIGTTLYPTQYSGGMLVSFDNAAVGESLTLEQDIPVNTLNYMFFLNGFLGAFFQCTANNMSNLRVVVETYKNGSLTKTVMDETVNLERELDRKFNFLSNYIATDVIRVKFILTKTVAVNGRITIKQPYFNLYNWFYKNQQKPINLMQNTLNSNQTFTSQQAYEKILFVNRKIFCTSGAYSGATLTVNESGFYMVNANILVNDTDANEVAMKVALHKNNSPVIENYYYETMNGKRKVLNYTCLVECNVGDQLDLRIFKSSNTTMTVYDTSSMQLMKVV